MGSTKKKLESDEAALGAWIMIGHPTVAEVYAGEGFDWIAVDMEHTATDIRAFHEIAVAVKGSGCDLLARLHSCDAVQAKQVLDAGANGIIVPLVNSPECARKAGSIASFPPHGERGAAFSRASDFGRNFRSYFDSHNDNVIVVIMLEHVDALANLDGILETPGLSAVFIGPYDLSASMGLAGQLDHPDVRAAQQQILDACRRHGVPAGMHVVPVDPEQVQQRIEEGYRFIACSMDTELLIHGCRAMLGPGESTT